MALDPARALGWRLRRHSLDPSAATTAIDVVGRVLALRGWPGATADLAVCVRQATPGPGDLERALDAGDLVQSYAFRGGSYVFTPDVAALVLSARTVRPRSGCSGVIRAGPGRRRSTTPGPRSSLATCTPTVRRPRRTCRTGSRRVSEFRVAASRSG